MQVGDVVVIHGLANRTTLNGRSGIVTALNAGANFNRVVVTVDGSADVIALKPENICKRSKPEDARGRGEALQQNQVAKLECEMAIREERAEPTTAEQLAPPLVSRARHTGASFFMAEMSIEKAAAAYAELPTVCGGGDTSFDVEEATRQLNNYKTAVVQCADGELCFLRSINQEEAVGEPLDGGDERTLPITALRQVTGYDSDEDGLLRDQKVTNAKRQRTVAGSSSTALVHQSSSLTADAASERKLSASEQMLRMAFPLISAHGTAELEASLRLLEKYELVCQGDDYADPECLATNSEALQYARARAAVKGLPWSLGASLKQRGPQRTIDRLKAEPYVGSSNARKIVDILQTGTCERSAPARPRRLLSVFLAHLALSLPLVTADLIFDSRSEQPSRASNAARRHWIAMAKSARTHIGLSMAPGG